MPRLDRVLVTHSIAELLVVLRLHGGAAVAKHPAAAAAAAPVAVRPVAASPQAAAAAVDVIQVHEPPLCVLQVWPVQEPRVFDLVAVVADFDADGAGGRAGRPRHALRRAPRLFRRWLVVLPFLFVECRRRGGARGGAAAARGATRVGVSGGAQATRAPTEGTPPEGFSSETDHLGGDQLECLP